MRMRTCVEYTHITHNVQCKVKHTQHQHRHKTTLTHWFVVRSLLGVLLLCWLAPIESSPFESAHSDRAH